MDRSERKRKRAEKVEAKKADDQMKGKEEAAAAEAAPPPTEAAPPPTEAAPPPTEEEVEELFAILRRMRVAVKYFRKEGKSGGDDTPAVEAVSDGGGGKRAAVNGGLDLNAVPEAESSSLI